MAMNGSTPVSLPPHLARYAVDQDYGAYTPRDHAVWRHILHRLTGHLKDKAHPSYLEGLSAAGIGLERIPSLEEMNGKLARLGWGAVAVRGFIPPAVFTEFQARGILAIAADIRTHEHIEYTPAPDIVHESAGHAPILRDARYAEYLKRAGEVGFRAIASREDRAVFEAIRTLSVVKEDPAADGPDLVLAQNRLAAALAGRTYASESTRASRLYWWTAEYGLVGSLERPRIYGAGLLSSILEAGHCLGPEVRRLPLSPACVDQDYDITRMQPQLFVALDFDHLFEVVDAFAATLAWKRGGDYGLEEAIRAGTVNHLLLPGGLQVAGQVVRRVPGPAVREGLCTRLAVLEGPVQVARDGLSLASEPWPGPALVAFGPDPRDRPGPFALALPGGLELTGVRRDGHRVEDLRGTLGGEPLDLPATALLVTAGDLPGVAGGPADPGTWDRWFGDREAFAAGEAETVARRRKAAALAPRLADLYREVARMRETGRVDRGRLAAIRAELSAFSDDWLLDLEVGELLGASGT
jgi:phenylalanine-4-hydroxylase